MALREINGLNTTSRHVASTTKFFSENKLNDGPTVKLSLIGTADGKRYKTRLDNLGLILGIGNTHGSA